MSTKAVEGLEYPHTGSPKNFAQGIEASLKPKLPNRSGTKFRAKFPKVKTGCMTCRTRRVKCDEVKPSCNRCSKFGVPCSGYLKPTSQPQTPSRKLVKKTETRPRILIRDMHADPRFTTEDEGRYYRYYCSEIASQINGPFSTSLWKRLIPQVGEMESCIKHGIIALGAISKARSNSDTAWEAHYEFALIQYGKALKGMRSAIQDQVRDCRNALIASILVFCFESLEGHQASASLQACGTVNLLYQYSQAQGGHKRTKHPSQCAQYFLLEEDLYSAFAGLDLQALLFLDTRPAYLHQSFVESMNSAVQGMPTEFVDLKDCRTFLQLIMRRNFHFTSVAMSKIQVLGPDIDNSASAVAYLRPGNNIWSTVTSTPQSVAIPSELLAERDRYFSDLESWEHAAVHLFQRTSLPENGMQEFMATTLLKIHAAMIPVMMARAFCPPETEYDVFLPEFRTITELSTVIYPRLVSPSSSMFHFDVGIIPALSLVASRCRDIIIRHQAVDLLLRTPKYREGIWDSMVVGKVNEAMMQIEEEWMDENGCIPGNRRASLLRVDCMLNERRAVPVFRQRIGTDREEDVVEREVVLRW